MRQTRVDEIHKEWDKTSDGMDVMGFYNKVQEEFGSFRLVTADYKEYGSVADDFIDIIRQMGGIVVDDPFYYESGTHAWIVWTHS